MAKMLAALISDRRAAQADATQARQEAVRAEGELAGLKIALQQAQGWAEKAEAEAAVERAARVAAEREWEAARGELAGLKLGLEHHHLELAQMRQEVAKAHNRAVVAEQQIITANERREGAEVALAKARSWNFLNFLFGREGKGRKP